MSRRAKVSPDRSTISTQRVWALTVLVGAQFWTALSSLPSDGRSYAAEAAALCAVLAMFGLRSVPIRWVVRGTALSSGMLLARFGELGALGGIGGSWRVLVWLAAAAAALVLAPSSRSTPGREPGVVVRAEDVPPPESDAARRMMADPAGERRPRPGTVPVALVVASIALVGAAALLTGPRAATEFPVGARVGDLVDLGDNRQDNALVASDELDMTRRPRLSDRVVMTVRSPLASFWRTETFDAWDGSTWRRTEGGGRFLDDDGRVDPSPEDLAAVSGVDSEQEFRIEVGFATAVPSAPAAVQVDSVQQLAQRPDGTLVSPQRALSRGTTYSVVSRQVPTTPERLRELGRGEVPDAVLERYAQPPVATDRTIQLAREVTDGLDSNFDKVVALEAWMDANTEYSLDAPLSPRGVDVVDHFLFDSQLGWCEQIASALVVMARHAGVPARLTTGFIPGDWDAVSGRFVVRELHAHAWAEVWFPEVGWVTFDPTASVPLAGTDEATPGAAAIDWREVAGVMLLAVGLTSLAAGPARRGARGWWVARAERRRRRARLRDRWDVAAEAEIERVGAAAGRFREPAETVSVYAGVVAGLVDDPSLADRGADVDRFRYSTRSD